MRDVLVAWFCELYNFNLIVFKSYIPVFKCNYTHTHTHTHTHTFIYIYYILKSLNFSVKKRTNSYSFGEQLPKQYKRRGGEYKRERETDREREREREREKTETDRHTQTETETDIHRHLIYIDIII